MYNIVFGVLLSHIKLILSHHILRKKMGFLYDRDFQDSFGTAQELLHTMKVQIKLAFITKT